MSTPAKVDDVKVVCIKTDRFEGCPVELTIGFKKEVNEETIREGFLLVEGTKITRDFIDRFEEAIIRMNNHGASDD